MLKSFGLSDRGGDKPLMNQTAARVGVGGKGMGFKTVIKLWQ